MNSSNRNKNNKSRPLHLTAPKSKGTRRKATSKTTPVTRLIHRLATTPLVTAPRININRTTTIIPIQHRSFSTLAQQQQQQQQSPPPPLAPENPTAPAKPPKFTLIRNEKVQLSKRQPDPNRRRVVVTGIGIVSPLGNDLDSVYESVLNGISAIKAIDGPELAKLNLQAKSYAPVGPLTEIVNNNEIIPRHLKQVLSRHQIYAMIATHNAMQQAGLIHKNKNYTQLKKDQQEQQEQQEQQQQQDGDKSTIFAPQSGSQQSQHHPQQSTVDATTTKPIITTPDINCQMGHETICELCSDEVSCVYTRDESDRFGVCIGSSIGCVEEIGSAHVKIQEKGGKGAGAYSLPKLLVNLAAGHLTQLYEARALTHTVSTACATGAHAIGDATGFIRNNKADIIIAGGAETGVSPLSLALFNRIHALSRQDVGTSGGPFTSQRDGFVMGEGAAILVLEEAEHAKRRGANIICEVLGYGLSSDAYHITQPHRLGRGAYMAMENALQDANIDMSSVDYINAHATSTPIGDIAEASAIRALTQVHYNKRLAKRAEVMKRNMVIAQSSHRDHDSGDDSGDSDSSDSTPAIQDKAQSLTTIAKTTAKVKATPHSNQLFSRPLVSSTKGHVGHLLGAAGALEAALSIKALMTNMPPPTMLRHGTISDNIPVNVLAFDDSTLYPQSEPSPSSSLESKNTTPRVMTHWENTYGRQLAHAKANLPPLEDLVENVDYYINSKGLLVFTQKYHQDKGYCCENACLNCPYDFTTEKLTGMKQQGLKQGQLTKPLSLSTTTRDIDVVMSNSFAFGGANATLIFGKYLDKQLSSKTDQQSPGIDSF